MVHGIADYSEGEVFIESWIIFKLLSKNSIADIYINEIVWVIDQSDCKKISTRNVENYGSKYNIPKKALQNFHTLRVP